MNIKIIILGIACLLLFLIPGYIFNIGSLTGIFLGAALVLYGYHYTTANAFLSTNHLVRNGMLVAMVAIALIAVLLTIRMVKATNNAPQGDETVVVLGCGVNKTIPSRMLMRRINAAYNYLCEHPDAIAILSGGKGNGEDISEAEAMFRVLTNRGISPDRLIKEDKSTSTIENLRFSQQIIQSLGINEEIVVITSDFHEYRASLIASSIGISCRSYPAHTPIDLIAPNYVRELYGILYQYLHML